MSILSKITVVLIESLFLFESECKDTVDFLIPQAF
ncbi:hypothetical protein FHS60_001761 [Alloprevotella rava]|uniref:Uncharacterized protein n=1 Tax=Alloprevotella rava TaxID=671218 RepID=A0A7W5UXC3_9BACT|nr:hypothetical protein [Alloprevotella rava]